MTRHRLAIIVLLVITMSLTIADRLVADSKLPPSPYAYRQLDDPAKEAAAKQLMNEIRCLVCESQSVADSDAELAGDMRSLIRQRIDQGEGAESIRRYLVERYGEQISYRPDLWGRAGPLWLLPILLIIGGFWLLRSRLHWRRSEREAEGRQ